eukprot:gene9558-1761_t
MEKKASERWIWSEEQKSILEEIFQKTLKRPPPEERKKLAKRLNAPVDKLESWFGNRTTKYNKENKNTTDEYAQFNGFIVDDDDNEVNETPKNTDDSSSEYSSSSSSSSEDSDSSDEENTKNSGEEEIYTVEDIVRKRYSQGRIEYLVKWQGYDELSEPISNFEKQCLPLIRSLDHLVFSYEKEMKKKHLNDINNLSREIQQTKGFNLRDLSQKNSSSIKKVKPDLKIELNQKSKMKLEEKRTPNVNIIKDEILKTVSSPLKKSKKFKSPTTPTEIKSPTKLGSFPKIPKKTNLVKKSVIFDDDNEEEEIPKFDLKKKENVSVSSMWNKDAFNSTPKFNNSFPNKKPNFQSFPNSPSNTAIQPNRKRVAFAKSSNISRVHTFYSDRKIEEDFPKIIKSDEPCMAYFSTKGCNDYMCTKLHGKKHQSNNKSQKSLLKKIEGFVCYTSIREAEDHIMQILIDAFKDIPVNLKDISDKLNEYQIDFIKANNEDILTFLSYYNVDIDGETLLLKEDSIKRKYSEEQEEDMKKNYRSEIGSILETAKIDIQIKENSIFQKNEIAQDKKKPQLDSLSWSSGSSSQVLNEFFWNGGSGQSNEAYKTSLTNKIAPTPKDDYGNWGSNSITDKSQIPDENNDIDFGNWGKNEYQDIAKQKPTVNEKQRSLSETEKSKSSIEQFSEFFAKNTKSNKNSKSVPTNDTHRSGVERRNSRSSSRDRYENKSDRNSKDRYQDDFKYSSKEKYRENRSLSRERYKDDRSSGSRYEKISNNRSDYRPVDHGKSSYHSKDHRIKDYHAKDYRNNDLSNRNKESLSTSKPPSKQPLSYPHDIGRDWGQEREEEEKSDEEPDIFKNYIANKREREDEDSTINKKVKSEPSVLDQYSTNGNTIPDTQESSSHNDDEIDFLEDLLSSISDSKPQPKLEPVVENIHRINIDEKLDDNSILDKIMNGDDIKDAINSRIIVWKGELFNLDNLVENIEIFGESDYSIEVMKTVENQLKNFEKITIDLTVNLKSFALQPNDILFGIGPISSKNVKIASDRLSESNRGFVFVKKEFELFFIPKIFKGYVSEKKKK